jgi:hypothetical protein
MVVDVGVVLDLDVDLDRDGDLDVAAQALTFTASWSTTGPFRDVPHHRLGGSIQLIGTIRVALGRSWTTS